jgi:hypothetical protein
MMRASRSSQDVSANRSRLKSWAAAVSGKRGRRARLFRALGLERLEGRLLLTITPQLNLPNNSVTFVGTDPANDKLYLRVVNDLLEYSTDGTTYTNQLDSKGDTLPVNASTVVAASIGSAPTFLTGMDQGGGVYKTITGGPDGSLGPGPITIKSNLTTGGANLAISASSITVDANVIVSTSSTSAKAGTLQFDAPTISVGTSAKLLATGATGNGKITLTATNTTAFIDNLVINPLTSDIYPQEAIITVGESAAIDGADVSLKALAGEQNLIAEANPYVQGLAIKTVQNLFGDLLQLPISVIVTNSVAKVELSDSASIKSSGSVTLSAQADGSAVGEGIYYGPSGKLGGLTFAYMRATTDAEALVDPNATITAASEVKITSLAQGTAGATGRVTQNTGSFPTNPNNIQISVAIAQMSTTSLAEVSQGATVTAGGNVTVKAAGKQKEKTSAETASYLDGRAGLTAALGFEDADVHAYVDGTIISGGTPVGSLQNFNPFSQVDFATSTIKLNPPGGASPGYYTGEPLVYSSGDGGAIPGLENRDEYYAIVNPINPNWIQLADSADDAGAGKFIQFQQYPTLVDNTTGVSLPITNVVYTSATTTVLGYDFPVPFTNNETLVYHGAPGQRIGGLRDGATYYAIVDPSNPNTLQLSAAPSGAPILFNTDPIFTSPDGSQTYDVATIDTGTNTFTLAATPPNLQNGSPIVYQGALGSNITGLTSGQTYYAIYNPSDPLTLQLAATAHDAAVANPAVQNQSPTLTWVDPGNVTHTIMLTTVDGENHELDFDAPPDVPNGQAVVYHAVPYQGINGLVDGTTYTAIIDPNDPTALQLSTSTGVVAIGADPTVTTSGGQTLSILTIDEGLHSLTLAENPAVPFANGDTITYKAALGTFIGSLVDGQKYVIVNYDPNHPAVIQLADPSNPGTPLDLQGAVDLGDDDNSYLSGTQQTLTPDVADGVLIEAKLDSSDNDKTKSGIGSEPKIKDVLSKGELLPQFTNAFSNILAGTDKATKNPVSEGIKKAGSGTNTSVTFAASVALQINNNAAVAEVGPQAVIKTHHDVKILAPVTEQAQTTSEATISKPDNAKSPLAAATAIVVALYSNEAKAQVDGGATIDAGDTFQIDSNVSYPFIFLLNFPDGKFDPSIFFGKNGVSNITAFLDGKLGLNSFLINSWARSVVKSPDGKVSIAGSVDYTSYDNDSEASIGAGASINQDPAYQDAGQAIQVSANTDIFLINLTGIFDIDLGFDGAIKAVRRKDPLQVFNVTAGQAAGGIGGSFGILNINDTNLAQIATGAAVHAGNIANPEGVVGLQVTADQFVFDLNLIQSGGRATSFGVSGTLAYTNVVNSTTAQIASGVGYTGGPVLLDAIDDSNVINTAGSIQKGNHVGFGITVAINVAERTTDALIGDLTSPAANKSTFDLGGNNVTITATNTGNFITASFAAAAVYQDPPVNMPPDQNQQVPQVVGSSSFRFGIAGSGDVGINQITDDVIAAINDLGTISNAGDITLTGDNGTVTFAGAGAVAIARSGTSGALGFAGSFSLTTLAGATLVYVASATINARSLELNSDRTGALLTLTAGASGAPREQGIAIAGSASIDTIDDSTEAYLQGATVTLSGTASLNANDDSILYAVAGSLAYGGKVGIGAALAYSTVVTSTLAYINQSILTQNGGTLTVSASNTNTDPNTPRIIAIAGSGAISTQGVSVAGMAAVTLITDTVSAYIKASTVNNTAAGDVNVAALDKSWIISAGGAIGVGNKAGVGFGLGYSQIDDTISAYLDGTTLNTLGGLSVTANSSPTIGAGAVGVGVETGQTGLAGAGSVSINQINDTISADISNQSKVTTAGPIKVTATDNSLVVSIAGAVAASAQGVAIGAAVDYNLIGNTIDAYIDGSSVQSTESGLTVAATGTPLIVGIALGVAGSPKTFTLGGSVTVNAIDDTVAAKVTASTINLKGDLAVTAADTASLFAFSGGIAGTGQGVAVGASLALDYLGGSFNPNNPSALDGGTPTQNRIIAVIDGSSVQAANISVTAGFSPPSSTPDPTNVFGSLTTFALPTNPTAQIFTISIGGTGAGSVALAGSVSLNWIKNDIEASITNIAADQSISAPDGAITLTAFDAPTITSAAGTISGAGTGAVGASVSYNYIGGNPSRPGDSSTNKVLASMSNMAGQVRAKQLSITSSSTATINNYTVAGSGAGTFSLGGSVSINFIRNDVESWIAASPDVATNLGVALLAQDTSTINAFSGQINGAGGVGIGLAGAYNDIANDIKAYIDGSSVTSSNSDVSAQAVSSATINAKAGGIAAAGKVAVAGSASINLIADDIDAYLNTATVNANGNVYLLAKSGDTVTSYGGTVSGAGAASVGGAVVVNSFGTTTDAYVAGSNVVAAARGNSISVPAWLTDSKGTEQDESIKGLAVVATNTATITVICATGAVGGTAGIGGNLVVNLVAETTKAHVDSSQVNSASAPGQDVVVRAHQATTIVSGGGVLTGGAAAAIGFVVDSDIVKNTTQAYITNSNVTAGNGSSGGKVEVNAQARELVTSATAGIAIAGAAAFGGGASGVNIAGATQAFIDGKSTVNSAGSLTVLADDGVGLTLGDGYLGGSSSVGGGGAVGVGLLGNTTTADITNATTNATGITTVQANSTESITLVAVSGGLGGLVGIGGSIGVIFLHGTTAASINASSVNQDRTFATGTAQTVEVLANDTVTETDGLGTLAIGALGGGVGASVDVITLVNALDAHIAQSQVSAAQNKVTVAATATKTISSYAFAFAGGKFFGINGTVSALSIGAGFNPASISSLPSLTSTTNDNISLAGGVMGLNTDDGSSNGNTPVNDTAKNAFADTETNDQSINGAVDPTKKLSLFNEALNRSAADAQAINRALMTTSAPSDVTAYVGSGSTVHGNGGVSVTATDTDNVLAIDGGAGGSLGVSVGGSVGVVNIADRTQAFVDDGATVGAGQGGPIVVQATFGDGPAKGATPMVQAYAGQGGTVGLGAQVAIINDSSTQLAFVGNTSAATLGPAVVNGGGDMTVGAKATRSLQANAKGGALGAAVAIGISSASVTGGGDTSAFIGQQAQVASTPGQHLGSLTVNASATNTLTTDVFGLAVSGLAGVVGGEAKTLSTANVKAYIDQGAQVHVDGTGSTGNLTIAATSSNSGTSSVDGGAGGLVVVVGEMTASALKDEGDTSASLNKLAGLTIGGNLTANAVESDAMIVTTTAGSGGVVALPGAKADAEAAPDVAAFLSSATGAGPFVVGGTAAVQSFALGNTSAKANGVSGGVVGVGSSLATSSWKPIADSSIGPSTNLTTTRGDIDILAFSNFAADPNGNINGTPITANKATSSANSSGGGVVSSVGAEADSTSISSVDAHIASGDELTAGNDINVVAASSNKLHADASGSHGGIVGLGSVAATGTLGSTVTAVTDDRSTANLTRLSAARAINFFASALNNAADSDASGVSDFDAAGVKATGGTGGLVGIGGAVADIELVDPLTTAALGVNTVVFAPNAVLSIVAQNSDDLKSAASQSVGGAIANNQTDATTNIDGSETLADISADSTVTVLQLIISSTDTQITELASSLATVPFNLGGSNTANAMVNSDTNAQASILGSATRISASQSTLITAAVNAVNTVSRAKTSTTGLTGTLYSNAGNFESVHSNVNTDAGSRITTGTLTINALRPTPANDVYVKDAQTDAKTVTVVVTEVIGTVCNVIGEVICLWGLICNPKTVCQDITRTITKVLGGATNTTTAGSQDEQNIINFNSNLTIGTPSRPTLKIDPTGKIVEADGITATVSGNQVLVDPIINNTAGSIILNAPRGKTTGASPINYNATFSAVDITNQSNLDVVLAGISVFNTGSPATIQNTASMDFTNWTYTLLTNATDSTIDVECTNPAGGNLILNGPIDNPIGTTILHDVGGGIISSGLGSLIVTRVITLEANGGSVGSNTTPVFVGLPVDNDGPATGITSVTGQTGVYLNVSVRAAMAPTEALSITIGAIKAVTGNVDVQINDSSYQDVTAQSQITLIDGTTVTGMLIDDTFNPQSAIVDNEITLPFDHGYTQGEQVTYQPGRDANGDPARPIGGLTPGGVYNIINVSPTVIKLGNTFNAATAVNPVTGTISFASPPGYSTGDRVVYDDEGNPPLAGLVNGQTYYVRVIDANTIKLCSTLTQATTTPYTIWASNVVSNSTFNLGFSHGYANGQAVTYTSTGAPIGGLLNDHTYYVIKLDDTNFQLSATVDGNGNPGAPITLDPSVATGLQSIGTLGSSNVYTFQARSSIDTTTDTINFGLNDGYETGDTVTYRSTGAPIGGLTNGADYYVVAVNPTTIGLTTSGPIKIDGSTASGTQSFAAPGGALGVSLPTNALSVNANDGTIDFGKTDGFTTGEAVIYSTTGTAIKGLVNGHTYHVVAVNATTIKLLATPFIKLDPSTATGTQTIGVEGIFIQPSTGTQSLVVPLDPSVSTGTAQRLSTSSTYLQTNTGIIRIPNSNIAVDPNGLPLITTVYATGAIPEDSSITLQGVSAPAGSITVNAGSTHFVRTDLVIAGLVSSPLGTTAITATGSLVSGSLPVDSVAATGVYSAGFNLGTSTAPFKTQVQSILAAAGAQGVSGLSIQNAGNLSVAGVTASGDVVLTVTSSQDQAGDLTLGPNASVASGQGMVIIQAAHNITVPLHTTVKSLLATTLHVGVGEGATGSSAVDVSGSLQGSTNNLVGDAGTDTVISTDDADFALGDTYLNRSVNGGITQALTLSSFENVLLTGGNGNNSFTVSDWTHTGVLNGGGSGVHTVISNNNVNFALGDTSLQRGSLGALTLHAIGNAILTGNAAFDVSNWSGTGTLAGTGSSAQVVANVGASNIGLSDTRLSRSGRGDLALISVLQALLTGSAEGHQIFTVANWSGAANLVFPASPAGLNNSVIVDLKGGGAGVTNITNEDGPDTGGSGTLTVNGPTAAMSFKLAINPGAALPNQVAAGQEQVNFLKPMSALNVNGQSAADTFEVDDVATPTNLNGNDGNDSYAVRAIHAPVTIGAGTGTNTIDVGSLAPSAGGTLDGIQGALTVVGSGQDAMIVDDAGRLAPTTGTLTATTLTGLGMGLPGITYGGLSSLKISLGSAGNNLNASGNTFDVTGVNPSTVTSVAGGASVNRINATFAGDFTGQLNLTQFAQGSVNVGGNWSGRLSDASPGNLQTVTVVGSLTPTGLLQVGSVDTLTIEKTLDGTVNASGALSSVSVSGNQTGKVNETGTVARYSIGGSLVAGGAISAINHATPSEANITNLSVEANLSGTVLVSGSLSAVSVGNDQSGSVTEAGAINKYEVGRSLVIGGVIDALNATTPAEASIANLTVKGNLGGNVKVSGAISAVTVGGDQPGTVSEAGTVNTYTISGSLVPNGKIIAVDPAKAAGNIVTLTIHQDLAGDVTASGRLTNVYVVNGSLRANGAVQADSIGTIRVGPVANQPAPGRNLDGLVAANLAIATISIGGDLSGKVTETQAINSLFVGGSVTGKGTVTASDPTPSQGRVGSLTVLHDLAGHITVSGALTRATVEGTVSGSVHEAGTIAGFTIKGSLAPSGAISAVGSNAPLGAITTLDIGGDLDGQVVASGPISTAIVVGNFQGSLRESHTLKSLTIGGSLSKTGSVALDSAAAPGNIDTLDIGANLSGNVTVGGTLAHAVINGDMNGTVKETGTITNFTVGQMILKGAVLEAVNTDNPPLGSIKLLQVGIGPIGGIITVSGKIDKEIIGSQVFIPKSIAPPHPTPLRVRHTPPRPRPIVHRARQIDPRSAPAVHAVIKVPARPMSGHPSGPVAHRPGR